jgi:hypothetical protein
MEETIDNSDAGRSPAHRMGARKLVGVGLDWLYPIPFLRR